MRKLAIVAVLALFCAAVAGQPAPAPTPAPDWGRIELIGAELFGVDPSHSYVGFTIGFLGLTRVRGNFKSYAAAILYDEKDPTRSSVTVVFDPASINTGSEMRDKDLKGPKFFDVEKFPKMIFRSQSIERAGKDGYVVHGTLEMHGVQKEVSIPMTQTVPRMPDTAWGNMRVGVTGVVKLKRTDFGINGNEFWGSRTLSEEVDVEINILGNRFNFDKWSFDSKEKPSIGQAMSEALAAKGVEGALARYRELKEKSPNDYNFETDQVALVASRLLQHRRLREALQVYRLAAAEWPKDPVLHARVGETCAAMGDRAAALAAYRKALELAPQNPEAIEMVRRLETPAAPSSTPVSAAPPAPDAAARQREALNRVRERIKGRENEPAETVFKNIELLRGKPASRLPGMMSALTGLIGVTCSTCHNPDRWESDELTPKQTARRHFKMQADLNRDYFAGANAISCWTCHRGARTPPIQ
jgi:polyisoprenoid-binding protein YceI